MNYQKKTIICMVVSVFCVLVLIGFFLVSVCCPSLVFKIRSYYRDLKKENIVEQVNSYDSSFFSTSETFDFNGNVVNLSYVHLEGVDSSDILALKYYIFVNIPRVKITFDLQSLYYSSRIIVHCGVDYKKGHTDPTLTEYFSNISVDGRSGYITVDFSNPKYGVIVDFFINVYYVADALIGTDQRWNYNLFCYTGDYVEGYGQGMESIKQQGYQEGYDTGYNVGYGLGSDSANAKNFNVLNFFLGPANEFMTVRLFGVISLGDLFALVLTVLFATIFIKMFAGG